MPLPVVYGVMTVAFFGAAVAWLAALRRGNKGDVHKIHHLMSLLVVIKFLSLLFESVMYHFIAKTGHSTGWNIVYYILACMRGLLLVAVIALIGAGWSLLKPFLNDKEKRVFAVVLPLQVLTNIAIIVTDEMDPGSMAFSAWVNVLHVADVLASVGLLFPVIWSIKHLRAAQEADRGDEKARSTLLRLTQFRSFYLTTIAYLYFTRIIVYLMYATLSYDRQWLSQFFDEAATLIYYVAAGFRFRPAAENSSYLRIPTDDDDGPGVATSAADGGAPGGTGVEMTGGGGGGAAGPVTLGDRDDADVARAKASGASTRVLAPSQTISAAAREAAAAAGPQTTAGSSALGRRAGAGGGDDDDEEHAAAGAGGTAAVVDVAPASGAASATAAAPAPASSCSGGGAVLSGGRGGKPAGAAAVAIADDDHEDDDFDLDDDDGHDYSQRVALKPAASAGGGGGASGGPGSGLKHVKPRVDEDDDF